MIEITLNFGECCEWDGIIIKYRSKHLKMCENILAQENVRDEVRKVENLSIDQQRLLHKLLN